MREYAYDFMDREYTIGDKVVFPRQNGHKLAMVLGIVMGFTDAGNVQVKIPSGWESKSKIVTLMRTDLIVKVSACACE